MIGREIDDVLKLAERYCHETNQAKIDECRDALIELNRLISDLRLLISLNKKHDETKDKGHDQ